MALRACRVACLPSPRLKSPESGIVKHGVGRRKLLIDQVILDRVMRQFRVVTKFHFLQQT
jgi:hypothetical protein